MILNTHSLFDLNISPKLFSLKNKRRRGCVLLFCFFSLLFLTNKELKAQFPNPTFFNTGVNAAGTGIIPALSNDLNWTVAMTNSLGPYVPAIVTGIQPGWDITPFTNADWISYPHTCSVMPSIHNCDGYYLNLFYKLTFNLPNTCQSVSTPSAYCLSFEFMADDAVSEIFVNGVLNYVTSSPTPSVGAEYYLVNKRNVTLCNNWQSGLNTIIFRVESGAGPFGGSEGFLAKATQTVSPLVTTSLSTIPSQTNLVCYGLNTGGAMILPSGGIAPYTYTWTPGVSSTNLASNLPAGNYTCIVGTSNSCTLANTFNITAPVQSTLFVSASTPSACLNNGVVLTATNSSVGPGNTYTWTGGSPNTNTVTVSEGIIGLYTYSVASRNANNCLVTNTISVSFNTSMSLGITNATICPGQTGTVSASGANTYTWNPGGVMSNSLTQNPTANTIYTVMGTSASGCTAVATATINVPSTTTLNISASSSSACVGNSITLTAGNSGGTPAFNYSWTSGPSTSIYITSRAAGAHIYTVVSRDANNCSATETISLNFINNPVLTVSDVSICPGSTATLNAFGATTYTWLPSSATGSLFTVSPAASSNYTLIGSSTGCSVSAFPTVIVKPVPSLSILTTTINCLSLGSATVTESGGIGPYSYLWSPSSQNSSIAINLTAGTHTVAVFDASTNCTTYASATLTALQPFTGTVSSTPGLTCNGVNTATAVINTSGGVGARSYTWTSTTGVQTTSMATGLSAGIHTINVADGITFCNVTHTFEITQPPALSLTVNSTSTISCVQLPVSFTASSSGGTAGYSYTWTPGPVSATHLITEISGGNYIYSVQSSDANNCLTTNTINVMFVDYPSLSVSSASICLGNTAILNVTNATTYTWMPTGFTGSSFTVNPSATSNYTVIGSVFGCNDTLITSVIVYTLPVPAITGTNVVCEGQLLSLSGSGGTGFNWNGPLGAFSSTPVFTINPAGLSRSGLYSLTVTSSEGCTASTSISVTIIPKPGISVTGAAVCIGMMAKISVIGGIAASWTGPSGFSATSSLAVIPIVDNSTTGAYHAVVTGSNSCTSSASVQVIGYPYALPVPVITTPSVICLNSGFVLQGSGGTSYLWNGPGSFSSALQAVNLTANSLTMSGVYTLTAKNNSNCVASTSTSITVYPLPAGKLISGKNSQCLPFCSDFRVNITSQPYPIVSTSFLLNDVQVSDTAFTHCFVTSGDHPFKIKLTDINGCTAMSSLTISAWPLPNADFEYTPAIPVENVDYVIFRNTSSGSGLSEFNWHFIANEGDSSQTKDPVYLFEKAGIFPVALLVKNKWGCSDTVVKSIQVNDNFSFYVPNSFSPNGDGINDVFQPKGVGIMKYKLEVFNRFGEKIFTSSDLQTGWDGTFKGSECKTDTYIWKIELTNPSGKQMGYSGHVNILNK